MPTARALWNVKPNLKEGAHAWILAGGAHHTCFSQNLSNEYLADYCDMVGIEIVTINEKTDINTLKNELRANSSFY